MGVEKMLRVIGIVVLAGVLAPVVLTPKAVVSFPGPDGNAAQDKRLEQGREITIKGKVLGREKRPEGVADSPLALRVLTVKYGVINVVYSAFRLCHNELGATVKTGDRIEVHGKVIGKDRITVCLSKTYYIKKL